MPSSQLAKGGMHMLTQHLLAHLLPLQKPCPVKVASDEEYLSEFGWRDTKSWVHDRPESACVDCQKTCRHNVFNEASCFCCCCCF
jgi:hypothetical protein